ncbi:lysyl-tRNA synthetase class 2 [Kitasatospora sp. MAP12-15]|uniref:amino acid--tRNA ligase-related protein n=1 Tax=unclassified Kitasatospora TaxID=2633591 RepID=UPI002474D4A4|nr:amino acid--tRNA ligase-related protein [Kitasatospora sp. MAP12-44]MDH6111422.1 lysyl-tRNA synthetase class 2 [Kitasatospora sp. MAP12-44]
MPALSDPIGQKSHVLFSLRDTLRDEGFIELVTPVARRADLGAGRRVTADLDGGRFLRAMIGPALRVTLSPDRKKVFEIGPCFRPEKPDDLHASEFTMLDLYAADQSFEGLIELAWRLVGPHLPYTPVRVSVADHIRDAFGVDLHHEPIGDLPQRMAARLGAGPDVPFQDVLGQYIERELETSSTGAAVFLTEYPLGGDEPCARLAPGTAAVLERFELIVDGIEVVHGYADERDQVAFAERAKAVGLYDDEQRLAWEAIDAGLVPAATSGLGIGIERLCAAAAGIRGIRPFLQSPRF